jgi:hypothetical protein
MKRHQSRAPEAEAKSAKIERVVAIHEAGHAVARYLTADDFGHTTDHAISYIDLAPATPPLQSVDGTMSLTFQATTYGPMLSTEIQKVATRNFADIMHSGEFTMEHVAEAIAKARLDGADIFKWLRARVLIEVFGAAAEAKYSGKAFEEVWGSHQTEADMRDAVQSCFLAGITEPEVIQAIIDEAQAKAVDLLERPEVWRAVVALADNLPGSGRFDGKEAAAIIRSAFGD